LEGKAWGLCTTVDLQDCHPDLIRNADHIRRYVELCEPSTCSDSANVSCGFRLGRVAGIRWSSYLNPLISATCEHTNNAYLDISAAATTRRLWGISKQFFGARRSTAAVTLRY
jgi:hypothetical protein